MTTDDYIISVEFTGLAGLTVGNNAGGKCYVRNRNTGEVKYYDATGKSATVAVLPVSMETFTSFANDQILEIGMMGDEHVTAIHTINTTKGGGKLTLAAVATTSTTNPNVTL